MPSYGKGNPLFVTWESLVFFFYENTAFLSEKRSNSVCVYTLFSYGDFRNCFFLQLTSIHLWPFCYKCMSSDKWGAVGQEANPVSKWMDWNLYFISDVYWINRITIMKGYYHKLFTIWFFIEILGFIYRDLFI